MTIANIVLTERSAVLFSDTALCDQNARPVGRVSKVRIVPHLNAAFVLRGPTVLARDLHEALSGDEPLRDFDHACDDLGRILSGRHAKRLEIGETLGHPPAFYRVQCHLVGWSPRRARMRLVVLDSDNGWGAVERMPGVYLEPSPSSAVRVPPTLTLAQAIAVADTQRTMMRANAAALADGSGIGIGGELIAVEITAAGLKVQTVHQWQEDEVKNENRA